MFCSKKTECWAGRNNSCPRLMKWGWPEDAYAIWRVGSVQAGAGKSWAQEKPKRLQPSQERRQEGRTGREGGELERWAEARLCSEVGCLDFVLQTWGFKSLQGFKQSVPVCTLSCVRVFATPWTIAHQAPLSMGFPRQEYWSGLPFLALRDHPDWPRDRTQAPYFGRQILYHCATWEALAFKNNCAPLLYPRC